MATSVQESWVTYFVIFFVLYRLPEGHSLPTLSVCLLLYSLMLKSRLKLETGAAHWHKLAKMDMSLQES